MLNSRVSAPAKGIGRSQREYITHSQVSSDDQVFVGSQEAHARESSPTGIPPGSHKRIRAPFASTEAPIKRYRHASPQATQDSYEGIDYCLKGEHLARLSSSCSTQSFMPLRAPSLPSFLPQNLSATDSEILSGTDSVTLDDLDGSAQSPRRRSPTPLHGSASDSVTTPLNPTTFNPELIRLLHTLLASESSSRIQEDYLFTRHGPSQLSPNSFIDASMRKMCVSWMVEVALEMALSQHTLHLSIACLDRFLSVTRAVPRSQLQLIGVACILAAAKHEEETHPSAADLCAMAAHSFTSEDLVRMEGLLLASLKFCLAPPTAYTFLSVLKGLLSLRSEIHSLAAYYLELGLLDYLINVSTPPSLMAAAAVVLAAGRFGDGQVLSALVHAMPGVNTQVGPCLAAFQKLAVAAKKSALQSAYHTPFSPVREKYSSACWHHAVDVAERVNCL